MSLISSYEGHLCLRKCSPFFMKHSCWGTRRIHWSSRLLNTTYHYRSLSSNCNISTGSHTLPHHGIRVTPCITAAYGFLLVLSSYETTPWDPYLPPRRYKLPCPLRFFPPCSSTITCSVPTCALPSVPRDDAGQRFNSSCTSFYWSLFLVLFHVRCASISWVVVMYFGGLCWGDKVPFMS